MAKIFSSGGQWYGLGAGLSERQVKLWMEEESKDLCDGLAVPVLKAKQSWYQGSTLREEIENIVITDNYTETGSEVESWVADDEDSGDITCYVDGTTLIIASNRTGGLAMHANSEFAFAGFTGAVTMTGQELLRVDRVHRGYGLFKNGGFKELGADNWNFRRAYNMIQAFMGCSAMVTANLGQSTLRHVNSMRDVPGMHGAGNGALTETGSGGLHQHKANVLRLPVSGERGHGTLHIRKMHGYEQHVPWLPQPALY